MEINYNDFAANWWAKKIESSVNQPICGLDLFQEELSSRIKSLVSLNGSLCISTYNGRTSNFLDEIASDSELKVSIPSGYEMRILFNNVFVYNSRGDLVASF